MRFLVKTTMDTQIANELVKSGEMKIVNQIIEQQKPEAVYFYEDQGVRSQILIVNIDDPSELPAIAEPWWQNFGGTVEFHPAMVPADLEKAMQSLG